MINIHIKWDEGDKAMNRPPSIWDNICESFVGKVTDEEISSSPTSSSESKTRPSILKRPATSPIPEGEPKKQRRLSNLSAKGQRRLSASLGSASQTISSATTNFFTTARTRSAEIFGYLFKPQDRKKIKQKRRESARQAIKETIDRPRNLAPNHAAAQMRSWPRYTTHDMLDTGRRFKTMDGSTRGRGRNSMRSPRSERVELTRQLTR